MAKIRESGFRMEDVSLMVGALLNADIPVCFTCDLNSFDGTLNPIPGQFGYVRLSIRM